VSVTVLNQGEQALLEDGLTGVAYDLRLYKTDVTAGLTAAQIDALDETDFTEATFTGYSAAAVGTGDWTITTGDPTVAVNVEKQFTSSANQTAQNIWGYYLTRSADGLAILFDQFPAPVVIEFLNDRIVVVPRVTLDDTEGSGLAVGDIIPSARATPAPGRLKCDGSAVSRTTYADLFAEIGTAYGAGDGSTTFNLPDFRQRFPLGKADSGTGASLGDTGGAIDHTHSLEVADGASSFAKFDSQASGGISPFHRRVTGVPSWTATIQASGGWNAQASSSSRSQGAELGGDTATENPPFGVCEYEIVYQR